MSIINYAIEIATSSTATDTNYGLVSGTFRFITGRPGYAGVPTYPTGEAGIPTATLQAHWYEGWISDNGLESPNRSIDIDISGTYGTMSGFKFKLIDAKASPRMWNFLATNSVYLTNRNITIYTVIDDVFYYAWSGVIVNDPYNEITHVFECKDRFRKIHKPIPPTLVTQTNFEEAKDQAKEIPVVIGDVSYSRLIPETADVEFKTLIKYWGNDGNAAPAYAIGVETTEVGFIGSAYIDLWTFPNSLAPGHADVIFTANELGDGCHYLKVAKATDEDGGDVSGVDKEFMIRIKGNKATAVDSKLDKFGGMFNLTRIFLAESVRTDIHNLSGYNFFNGRGTSNYQNNIGIDQSVWYFNIVKMAIKYYISESSVESIRANTGTGFPSLYLYNNDTETYEDHSYLVGGYDLDPVDGSKPYLILNRDSMTIDGSAKVLAYYKPDRVLAGKNDNTSADLTTIMTDRDRTTYQQYSMTANPYNTFNGDRLNIDIDVPTDILNVACDRMWLCTDIDTFCPLGGFIFYQINPHPNHFGIFTQEGVDEDSIKTFPLTASLGTVNLAMLVPQEYYNMGGNSTGFVSVFQNYEFVTDEDEYQRIAQSVEMDQTILDSIKDGTYVPRLRLRITTGGAGTLKIRQIAFVVERSINLTSEPLYIRVSGEPVTDQGTGTHSSNVYSAFRLLLENYDEIPFADIDYGNLATTRNTWHCGRALDKRKSSFDYIKELCEQSFVALFPTRSGKRKLTAWRENTTSVATHTQATILRGSLGEYSLTPIEKLYNAFHIKFATDPGSGDYVRSYYIDGIDVAAFPGVGTDWSPYVGGLNAGSYAEAKTLWDVCHESYVRAQVIAHELPSNLSNLDWYTDVTLFNPDATEFVGTDSSAWKYLVNLVEWTTRQKQTVEYSLPLNDTTIVLDLLDRVTFSDTIYTVGTTRDGWITKIGLDLKKHTMEIELTLDPWDQIFVGDDTIIETGNADTIVERSIDYDDDQIIETGV